MKKKYFIVFIDIVTIILIIFHTHSLLLMNIEKFSSYVNYRFVDYIFIHDIYGILKLFSLTEYRHLFFYFSTLIYILNISVINNKYRDIRKKNNIFSGKYKYTIIINILFVVFKTLQYFIIITIITGLWKFFI
ncbi:hypothetical protein SAMN02745115_01415 [[Eubacterium] yurii]|nr:hypothetical protein SAMN02745115_01415 [[Eubacterium] yurii]